MTFHDFPQVYAPQRLQLDPLRDSAIAISSMREAYEAAAMGPRGACLKEQGGARSRRLEILKGVKMV